MEKDQLQQYLGEPVLSVSALSGGDIAFAQKVQTNENLYFVKSASFPNAKELFEKEVIGLRKLKESKTIGIPKFIGSFQTEQTAGIILQYIEVKRADEIDMEVFGRKLAHLHLTTNDGLFGLESDNFIGRLPQPNELNHDWVEFYIKKRLLPQLYMAEKAQLISTADIPTMEKMIKVCRTLFGSLKPALLHGDLWSGNYLIAENGDPYLIDPSVYYGHNEVDLAMTKLFGGFSNTFYEAYHEIIPPHENQKELTEIYQLYYLLVHLNLFGMSYLNSVRGILSKYFV